ncbi:MAG TPA: DUF5074 domain-containing protein [Cytophagaceae bacterium]|jgi:hypothetical protein|nr:DUF5074 domain-containing protein [Cytophagaceae bacterium]
MNKQKTSVIVTFTVLTFLFLASCKKKVETTQPSISEEVFVLNEGAFGNGNASVSIFSRSTNKMYNNLFTQTNNRPIGDVLQSMTIANGKFYFVVNNSNKIEVTDNYPLTSTGTINGLSLPRYMAVINSTKAYVTEYVSYSSTNGRISILNLTNNTISGTISTGTLPEQMILSNGKIFACISGQNKIAVIDPSTDVVDSTITASDGPTCMVKDVNGKIWVLCAGITVYGTNYSVISQSAGALVRINPANGTIEAKYTFPVADASGNPPRLSINGSKNMLYYIYNSAVYSQDISATSVSTTPVINRAFYGLGIDSTSNTIYTGTYGFSSNQYMVRYTQSGTVIDSFEVGIGPNGFLFNY